MPLSRKTRSWTPQAIPFGTIIALLGLWAFLVPLIGCYFNFGFDSDSAWRFTTQQWELQLIPGLAAIVGGVMLMTPQRGWGWLGATLAFLAGAWLVVGPSFYPAFSGGTLQPLGSEWMHAARWVGHFYGPGGLLLYFSGYANGLYTRRTIIQETPVEQGPVVTQRTVTPE